MEARLVWMNLAPDEQEAILEAAWCPACMKSTPFEVLGGRLVARFTASELDDMLGYVAEAANHTRQAKLRAELDALYERLEPLEQAAGPSGDEC